MELPCIHNWVEMLWKVFQFFFFLLIFLFEMEKILLKKHSVCVWTKKNTHTSPTFLYIQTRYNFYNTLFQWMLPINWICQPSIRKCFHILKCYCVNVRIAHRKTNQISRSTVHHIQLNIGNGYTFLGFSDTMWLKFCDFSM